MPDRITINFRYVPQMQRKRTQTILQGLTVFLLLPGVPIARCKMEVKMMRSNF